MAVAIPSYTADLKYWYDPVGNITLVKDASQRALFFNNSIVLPELDYTYDAVYRLATGREKIGNATFGTNDNYNDASWMGNMWKADDNGCQNYIQRYSYDPVGNIITLQHIAGVAGSYTRNYLYATGSNRLLSTTVSSNTYTYTYDARGNMVTMPHLAGITFNADNYMSIAGLGGGGNAYYQYSGGQRSRKTLINGSIKEELIYFGDYEIYRKFIGSSLGVERVTIHVSDHTGRIAMVEILTQGSDGAATRLD